MKKKVMVDVDVEARKVLWHPQTLSEQDARHQTDEGQDCEGRDFDPAAKGFAKCRTCGGIRQMVYIPSP
jgi:hypothetical protein